VPAFLAGLLVVLWHLAHERRANRCTQPIRDSRPHPRPHHHGGGPLALRHPRARCRRQAHPREGARQVPPEPPAAVPRPGPRSRLGLRRSKASAMRSFICLARPGSVSFRGVRVPRVRSPSCWAVCSPARTGLARGSARRGDPVGGGRRLGRLPDRARVGADDPSRHDRKAAADPPSHRQEPRPGRGITPVGGPHAVVLGRFTAKASGYGAWPGRDVEDALLALPPLQRHRR